MKTDGKAEEIRTTVAGRARQRAWREADRAISVVLADPEVQRLRALIEQEEVAAGRDLRDELQAFRDRYDHAVRTRDVAALALLCPGKHARWGRVCVLTTGHQDELPHWGTTPKQPVAWIGSTPDDD